MENRGRDPQNKALVSLYIESSMTISIEAPDNFELGDQSFTFDHFPGESGSTNTA